MPDIQVDMFEVQLGASIMLQFMDNDGDTIRVLADAGVHSSKHPVDHVAQQLPQAIKSFRGSEDGRIDLIIGTHYDADHLEGFVPIIESSDFDIGEAWMPPVANDTDDSPLDSVTEEHHYLAKQFEHDEDGDVLNRYLRFKAKTCLELERLISEGVRLHNEHADEIETNYRLLEYSFLESERFSERDPDTESDYFTRLVTRNNRLLGDKNGHGNEEYLDIDQFDPPSVFTQVHEWRYWDYPFLPFVSNRLKHQWETQPSRISNNVRSLAYIQNATAKDAINAKSLNKVVKALKDKGIPIYCNKIPAGQPVRYSWDSNSKRFRTMPLRTEGVPKLTLLGPSDKLIDKHRHRLPVGSYALFASMVNVPIKSITPSNQLSYVAVFEHNDQKILISGDAGCVDFKHKPRAKDYYPRLLNELKQLHVIQVAHHAGNNAHFYRVLLNAGYAEQPENSYLLLSHATHDRYRPSSTFKDFVDALVTTQQGFRLLFTCEPDLSKVNDYLRLIHQAVGQQRDEGDVRLIFDNQRWEVTMHAVAV